MPNGYGEYSLSNHDQRAGFVAGAEWQAAQQSEPVGKSETRITDEMVEAAEAAWEAAYDDHRSDANCMRAALVAALEGEQQ